MNLDVDPYKNLYRPGLSDSYARFQKFAVWVQAVATVCIILTGAFLLPYFVIRFGWGY